MLLHVDSSLSKLFFYLYDSWKYSFFPHVKLGWALPHNFQKESDGCLVLMVGLSHACLRLDF